MTSVVIERCVEFSPNNGVAVFPEILQVSDKRIRQLLETAYAHISDPPLLEACHGGRGPLAGLGRITFEDYLERISL